jgi:hypothetical protein
MIISTGNKKKFILLNILSLLFFGASEQAFAWTKSANFESGSVGSLAQGTSGFDYAGSATTFSSDKSASGSKSAKMLWPKGSEGWTIDHGELNNSQNVTNGQEIWARGYYYFASPWSWANAGGVAGFIKILRIHIANSSGGNVGYLSFIANASGQIISSNEAADYGPVTGAKLDTDAWQCLEIYANLSTSSPVLRMWKNGVLIFEDTSHRTISSTSDYANFTYIMTTWNGGAPQNQTEYVDEFVVTTDRPSQVDSKGNYMIGPVNGTSPAPPTTLAAPSNLKVK